MRDYWQFIGIIVALLLAGLSAWLPDSDAYAATLLSLAVFLSLVLAFREYTYHRKIDIILDPAQTLNDARAIYEEAARYGGELYATHVLQHERDSERDIAATALASADPGVSVLFERIIIYHHRGLERQWVEHMFSRVGEKVDMAVVVLKQYPLLLPHFFSSTLPKANLLLYRRKRKCISLVGLDHLHLPATIVSGASTRPGFSLLTRRHDVFDRLRGYFEALKKSRAVAKFQTSAQYRDHVAGDLLPPSASAALEAVVRAAEEDDRVVHVALFGSLAKRLLGVTKHGIGPEHEMDVDLLVVHANGSNAELAEVRSGLLRFLHTDDLEIVWGPDTKTFYPWRNDGKVNIDIELLPVGTTFYDEHPLLGTSIFSYLLPVYSATDVLSASISTPSWPMTTGARWRIVLEDRMGFLDCMRYLDGRQCPIDQDTIDYRRVITWVIRNLAWAMSGHHSPSTREALKVLDTQWKELFSSIQAETISDILALDSREAREKRETGIKVGRLLASDAVERARERIGAAD